MSMDTPNGQNSGANQQNNPAQTQTGGVPPVNDDNPQQGDQWDNYQTRELSGETGEKITEDELLTADEASKQQPQHRGE